MSTLVGGLIVDEPRFIWKVDSFLQLNRLWSISCPLAYANKEWYLILFPTGNYDDMCKGWMYVRLVNRTDEDICFRVRISLIGRDDKVIVSSGADWRGNDYFEAKIINRAELEFLGEEAMPGGTLTIVCEIQASPSVYGITMYHESGQEKSEFGLKESKNSKDSLKDWEILELGSKQSQISGASLEVDDGTTSAKRLSKSVLRLLQDLEGMLLNGSHSDVTLTVAGKSYKAHKAVLAARSTTFADIFALDASSQVPVDFRNAGSFSDFLHYLYAGNDSEVTGVNARDLHELAVYYGVDELKLVCRKHMVESVST